MSDTPPPPSEIGSSVSSSAVSSLGSSSQSFTQSEQKALQAEARRLFSGYNPSGGYNQTETGTLCTQYVLDGVIRPNADDQINKNERSKDQKI